MSGRADIATGRWLLHAELARTLWDEGMLASDIARRVGHGCSKNAVLGFAHRHGWPPRPSPIAVNGIRASAAVPRKAPRPHKKPKVAKAPAKPKPPPAPPKAPQPSPEPEATTGRACQWTDSDERPWVFCGKPVVPGSPYCTDHRLRAYNRPPRMAEAA